MNCSEWEERLALYEAGDLASGQAAGVERHLGECPGCQMFAGGLKASLELLLEAHEEPLAAAHFTAVRARVLAELRSRRRPFWRRRWAVSLAGAAAVLVLLWSSRPLWLVPAPPVVALSHPPVMLETVSPVSAAHPAPHQNSRPHRPRVGAEEPVILRVLTDNPDVVLYWIADKRGE